MPKVLLPLVAVLFLASALAVAASETVLPPIRTATGRQITLSQSTCKAEKDRYLCAGFDAKNPGYQWRPDGSNTCADAKCRSWLEASALFCQEPGSPCRGLRPGMKDRKGLDQWATCFKSCDAEMQLDRKAVCLGCGRFDVVAKPPVPIGIGMAKPDPARAPPPDEPGGEKRTPDPVSPRPRSPDITVCDSGEECLRGSAETQRRAEEEARQRRTEYLQALREARENQQSTITSATAILRSWKRQLDSRPAGAAAADERARYQGDRRLVSQAQAAVSTGDGRPARATFSGEDALRANDPDIMRQLTMNADFHDQEKAFGEDAKVTEAEEERFHSLAAETLKRADALHSAPDDAFLLTPRGGGSAPMIPIAGAGRGGLSFSSSGAGDVHAETRRISAPGPAAEITRGPASSVTNAGDDVVSSAPGLRDLLRRRLAEHAAAGAKDEAGGGQERLTGREPSDAARSSDGPPAPASREGAGVADPGNQAEVAGGAGAGALLSGHKFTLGFIETEAEVRRLTSEQGTLEGGLLGMDSLSLFDRVRQAHRSCLERGCVR